MPKPKNINELEVYLRGASCITSVERGDLDGAAEDESFTVTLAPELEDEFLVDVRELLGGRRRFLEDAEVDALVTALLLRRLHLDAEIGAETDANYFFDPKKPSMPRSVLLTVHFKKAKKAAKKKNVEKKLKKQPVQPKSFSAMSEEERRNHHRREAERRRSGRRRSLARAKKLDAGEEVKVGRVGYTHEVWDETVQKMVWAPTPGVERVMREVDRVWGGTITSGSALAFHLNGLGLRSLNGRPFTRNMMTSLLRHLTRLRRSRARARHEEPTG